MMDPVDLDNRFQFHSADAPTAELHEAARGRTYELACWLDEYCPDSREKALAITHLEEVMFWANAAIARH